ncbi:MAG: 2-hydroxyacyl-CoA dehydratase subunit D [Bacteroidales bacterium]
MKNFEKSSIISDVAYNKRKADFLPRDEQSRLNHAMKDKLLRFVSELQEEESRPQTMKQVDSMMNEMHGQRVKDLYKYRKAGNHVVSLLCNSIPPELIYGIDNCIPVTVCMGGGEVESYADDYTHGMCSVTRSMTGFLSTGMCVFFNVSDYVIASGICCSINKTANNIKDLTNDLLVYSTDIKHNGKNDVKLNTSSILQWIHGIKQNEELNKERLLKYARIYSELRQVYRSIMDSRKEANPPINGKNTLWAQQLFLVEDPEKLLASMKELEKELQERINAGKGYDPEGKKKRILLITPRIMPPFTEIYRLIEKNNALIVHEKTCMGIDNFDYQPEEFARLLESEDASMETALKYTTENMNNESCACFSGYDFDNLKQSIKEYNVDAVINYSFSNCPKMELKIKDIKEQLQKEDIPVMNLQTDYLQIYEKEEEIVEQIGKFLSD